MQDKITVLLYTNMGRSEKIIALMMEASCTEDMNTETDSEDEEGEGQACKSILKCSEAMHCLEKILSLLWCESVKKLTLNQLEDNMRRG